MRFVPQKTVEQQDLQCLHRVHSRLVANRTQLINQIRGLLAEYGIVLPQHPGQVRSGLPAVLEDAENQLTGFGRELFQCLYEELAQLDEKIGAADGRTQIAFQNTPDCRRIAAVEGVGPLIATAIVAAISNGHAFENGRQFSAWLGLVPRQNSSGGKSRLLGISKRGDPYLRTAADSWSAIGGLSSKSQD
jgi:transposase